MPYLCNADIHGRGAWTCCLDCSCDLAQADLQHPVVMVDVAEAQRAIPAGEEHLVRVRDPHRSLVREREVGVGSYGADGRVRAEDVEELRVEDLEEWWGRAGGVEELSDGVIAEGAVNAEDVEREGIYELSAIDIDGT